jgi:hypothetical protein
MQSFRTLKKSVYRETVSKNCDDTAEMRFLIEPGQKGCRQEVLMDTQNNPPLFVYLDLPEVLDKTLRVPFRHLEAGQLVLEIIQLFAYSC